MNNQTLEKYFDILNHLNIDDLSGNSIVGSIYLDNEKIEAILELEDAAILEEFNLEIEDEIIDLDNLKDNPDNFLGYNCQISLVKTKPHDQYFIAPNWDEFLQYKSHLLSPVKALLLTETKSLLNDSGQDAEFKSYLSISRLLKVLHNISDTTSNGAYSFFYNKLFNISPVVTHKNLSVFLDVKHIEEFLEDGLNKEAKTILLKETLISFLKDKSELSRLDYLITHFDSFYNELQISYANYVTNYSFSTLRKEYTEKKVEYIGKINNVFHDVTSKILAIPFGVWLATNQITYATNIQSIIKNCLIAIVVIGMFLIVILNFIGHFRVLNSVIEDYKSLFKQFKTDSYSRLDGCQLVVDEVDEILKALNTEASHVRSKLYLSVGLIGSMIVGTAFLSIISFIPK